MDRRVIWIIAILAALTVAVVWYQSQTAPEPRAMAPGGNVPQPVPKPEPPAGGDAPGRR